MLTVLFKGTFVNNDVTSKEKYQNSWSKRSGGVLSIMLTASNETLTVYSFCLRELRRFVRNLPTP